MTHPKQLDPSKFVFFSPHTCGKPMFKSTEGITLIFRRASAMQPVILSFSRSVSRIPRIKLQVPVFPHISPRLFPRISPRLCVIVREYPYLFGNRDQKYRDAVFRTMPLPPSKLWASLPRPPRRRLRMPIIS